MVPMDFQECLLNFIVKKVTIMHLIFYGENVLNDC